MRVLLDTHVLLAFLEGRAGIRRRWYDLILDPANQVHVSMVSCWEIALKMRIGKLDGDFREIEDGIGQAGFREVGVTRPHLRTLAALPLLPGHRYPFDHLLIAQAIAEDLVLAISDRQATRYPVRILA